MTAPRRHWSSFSLRTLFVVVTVFGIVIGWLAWNVRIVRSRQLTRTWVIRQGGAVHFNGLMPFHSWNPPAPTRARNADLDPSWVRRLLGDERVELLECPRNFSTSELDQVAVVFPEAEIQQLAPPRWPSGFRPKAPIADKDLSRSQADRP
jgi:hypothetical protein